MSVSIEISQTFVLGTPGAPQSLALLPSGGVVVGCAGQSPGTVAAVPFSLSSFFDGRSKEPLQAGALLQLSGGDRIALLGSSVREEVFALVYGGAEPAIYGVDCEDVRPLWRIALAEGPLQFPVRWRGCVALPDPPGGLIALDGGGHEVLEASLPAPISAPLVALDDGHLLLGLKDGTARVLALDGAEVERFEAGALILGLCGGPGGRVYAAAGEEVLAFERGSSAPVWRVGVGLLSGSIASDPRGNVHAALDGAGMVWLAASGGEAHRVIGASSVRGLALDVSGAVLGAIQIGGRSELLAWPLAGAGAQRPPAASPRRLPSGFVDKVMEPHWLAVLCESGELLYVRVVV